MWQSIFAELYIFNNNTINGLTLVYSDENEIPLQYYNGKLLGPIKIWEVTQN